MLSVASRDGAGVGQRPPQRALVPRCGHKPKLATQATAASDLRIRNPEPCATAPTKGRLKIRDAGVVGRRTPHTDPQRRRAQAAVGHRPPHPGRRAGPAHRPHLGRVRPELAPGATGSIRLAPLDPAAWSHLHPGDLITMHESRPPAGTARVTALDESTGQWRGISQPLPGRVPCGQVRSSRRRPREGPSTTSTHSVRRPSSYWKR